MHQLGECERLTVEEVRRGRGRPQKNQGKLLDKT